MPNLKEIVFRAHQIAMSRGIDPHKSPVVDAGMTSEALYPHALRFVISKALAEGSNSATDFSVSHDIEIVDGSALIPDTILREYMDHSYLTNEPYAAFVKYPDYQRNRFNNLLCYFTFSGGRMYYSCDSPKVVRQVTGFSGTSGDDDFSGSTDAALTVADIGRRIRLSDGSGLVIDSFIGSSVSAGAFTARGQALATPSPLAAGTIYESDRYITSRSLTAVNTTAGSESISCTGANFTEADLNRRLRVTVGGVIVVDAFIADVKSDSDADLTAKALSSTAAGLADVMFPSVSLTAPSVPSEPTDGDEDIDISPNLVEDVIAVIAAALTGEMKLDRLIKKRNFDK